MKMDLGNYLYILVGIIWLIYSFVSKNKKRKTPQQENEGTYQYESEVDEEPEDIIYEVEEEQENEKSVLEELFVIEKPKPVVTNEQKAPIVEQKSKPPPVEKTETEIVFEEGKGWIPKQVQQPSKANVRSRTTSQKHASKETEWVEESPEAADFDLREAVIQSVIFNRPDY